MSIAGSDPSGGAGIQADLKTFHQHGVYGTSVLTLLTIQNTRSVSSVRFLDSDFVVAQLDAVLEDIPPAAAKTGALGSADVVAALADRAAGFVFPLVVDPVLVSKHGASLLDPAAIHIMKRDLIPRAFLLTPNLAEASLLTGLQVEDPVAMREAARKLADLGAAHVLIKGGHLAGEAVDVLWSGGAIHEFRAPRLESRNTHGSGCVLSAAITARLARGEDILPAVQGAKAFITEAIRTAPGLGGGFGPVNFHAQALQRDAERRMTPPEEA